MKLYNGPAGNPRRVRLFIAEKNITVPRVEIDITAGETREAAFLKKNSLGELPILELDDGTIITESVAICRYLEELYPDTNLFGANTLERAQIEMWNRRIEFHIFEPLSNIVRHEFPYFADKMEQLESFALSQRKLILKNWSWLNEELSDGREFIAGDKFSIADVTGMAALMAAEWLKTPPSDSDEHVNAWGSRMKRRDSWEA